MKQTGTDMMVRAASLLLLAALPAAAQSIPGDPQRFAPVADLAGSCWMGVFSESGARDVHCYEWALDGGFIRDRHEVHGAEGTYAGETFYGPTSSEGELRFWYFNTLGGVSEGGVRAEEGSWTFSEIYSGGDRTLEMRTVMTRPDEDAYEVVTEQRSGEKWTEIARVRYTRLGRPRPAAVGGPWAEGWDLVFNTARDGNYEVYRRDLVTGAERNLTSAPGTEWAYAGGSELILVSDRASGSERGYRLYRQPATGGELERVTEFPVADSWVGLAPEGGLIVCAAVDGDRELLLLDPDGIVTQRLTDNDAEDCQPDVSPDGKTVVFWSDRSGSGEIWAMDMDGSNPRQLTHFPGNDGVPAHRYGGEGPPRISPDGSRITWMSVRDGEDWDIYTMAVDGSDVRRLTDHLADDGYPSWSPDGRFIAFDSDRTGSADVHVMAADGSGLTRVTDHPGSEQAPVWVPRGP